MSTWPPVQPPAAAAPVPSPAGTLPWDRPTQPIATPTSPAAPGPEKPKVSRRFTALICGVAVLGSAVGAGATYVLVAGDEPKAEPVVATAPSTVKVGDPVTRLPGVATAAEAVATALLPSIVKVETRSGNGVGTGSGVIYSSDGYIITNDHVVDTTGDLTVQLHTGEVVPAEMVGTAAPLVDIAVLKIDKTGLKAAKFGSSHDLKVGELAVAIGNPLGLEASVSAGVISGLHRNGAVGRERFIDSIQTDAPLNPGNSGGALANADAEVIGINTLVISPRDTGNALGLAISADTVKAVAKQIIEGGSAQLAFIGIGGEDALTGMGAVVRSLTAGGPAQLGGVQLGDTILSIDGDRIDSMDSLVSELLTRKVGDKVELEIERSGVTRTLEVTLQARRS